MKTITIDTTTATLLRSRLLELARRQDELAAEEAMATPYWNPQPTSVSAISDQGRLRDSRAVTIASKWRSKGRTMRGGSIDHSPRVPVLPAIRCDEP